MAGVEDTKKAWQSQAQNFESELNSRKYVLFKLQPPDQVADSQVSGEWDTMCQQIDRWIHDDARGIKNLQSRTVRLKDNNLSNNSIGYYWSPERQKLAAKFQTEYRKYSTILFETVSTRFCTQRSSMTMKK